MAIFRIAGGVVRAPGNPPGYDGFPVPANGCAAVYADGVSIGRLVVSAVDQDFLNGLTPADVSLALGDRLAFVNAGVPTGGPAYRARSDFDGDGDIDPADVAVLVAFRLEASVNGATISGAPACP